MAEAQKKRRLLTNDENFTAFDQNMISYFYFTSDVDLLYIGKI